MVKAVTMCCVSAALKGLATLGSHHWRDCVEWHTAQCSEGLQARPTLRVAYAHDPR